jgi:hypothetical protein
MGGGGHAYLRAPAVDKKVRRQIAGFVALKWLGRAERMLSKPAEILGGLD